MINALVQDKEREVLVLLQSLLIIQHPPEQGFLRELLSQSAADGSS